MSKQSEEFIKKLAPYALEDYVVTKILPSLTIAQGALESAWGTSGLSRNANNLFGVKGSGNDGTIEYLTNEFVRGAMTRVKQYFRKYKTWGDSVTDHSRILQLSRYRGIPGEKDYKTVCRLVKSAGYATDPNYTQMLIDLIETNGLLKYDLLAFGMEAEKERDEMKEIKVLVNGKTETGFQDKEGRTLIYASYLPQLGVNAAWNNNDKVLTLNK